MKINTFYHGDCLTVLSHDIDSQSIDLIYLDPPFFTGKVQKGTVKANAWMPEAMEVSYEDSKAFWKEQGYATSAPEWLKDLARRSKRPDFASYLYYMAMRLHQCHRVLKPTGSIYLHCDEKASHYLKMIMDEIFGYTNYRNEIIWHYGLGAFRTNSKFPSKHDDILFYTKSNEYTFSKLRGDVTPAMRAKYCHTDEQGNYMMSYGKKYYLKGGKPIDDVWDIPNLSATDKKERVGYPTQKPLALLEQIILASSQDNGIVLDPFCGCGTAILAAHKHNRQWIGIDINSEAYRITGLRGRNQLPLLQQGTFSEAKYVERDLEAVKSLKPMEFEKWVNEYYQAVKPNPDRGIDGITPDGIPIQTKTFVVRYDVLSQFNTDVRTHPAVPKPVERAIVVSQVGFDDSAREQQDALKGELAIDLVTPEAILGADTAKRVRTELWSSKQTGVVK